MPMAGGHESPDGVTRHRNRVKALRMAANALSYFAQLSAQIGPLAADEVAVVASAIRVVNAERVLCIADDLRAANRKRESRTRST